MSTWRSDTDGLGERDLFDPLCIERSPPMDDDEAELVEAICRAATPGPMMVDDGAPSEAVPVVGLTDGRMIVSLGTTVDQVRDEAVMHANAQLICKARYLLLRLLRDRQRWQEEREWFVERIRTLETALGIEGKDSDGPSARRPR